MGRREKKAKTVEFSSSEEDKKTPVEVASSDDDAEANEDLSLRIIQKSIQRAANNDPRDDGVAEIITNLKEERKTKEKKKRKKSKEPGAPEDSLDNVKDKEKPETDKASVVSVKDKEKPETEKATEVSGEAVETNPVGLLDNVVLRKLLRGPRYFDPPDNSWGACYKCGEEGHTTVNCTSAKRRKPCFVCGSLEHNAKQCSKGRDCFICKQQGHRAKDCPEKNNSSKICLKCGDLGHEMFSCRNDYCPDDLKEIQCYVCGRFGHLCCIKYTDPGPREVSCYRCGLSGHTGLACTRSHEDTNDVVYYADSCFKCGLAGHYARECTSSLKACTGSREDTNDVVYNDNSCYKCGLEGHFARECTSSSKAGKRYRDPSTPNQRSSRTSRKKKSQYLEFTLTSKTKHRGGWTSEDPGDYHSSKTKEYDNGRSPSTPTDRRSRICNGDYASSSRSSKRPRKLNFNNSASKGSARFDQHNYSASRFGNSANEGKGRSYNRW